MAAPSPITLPHLRDADPIVMRWAEEFVGAVERELTALRTAAGQTSYTVSNVTESRTLDPTTATLPQTGQVLATVINDLKKKGALA